MNDDLLGLWDTMNLNPGTYKLRLRVYDDIGNWVSDFADVEVVEPPEENLPPYVIADPDQEILITQSAVLRGTAWDDMSVTDAGYA